MNIKSITSRTANLGNQKPYTIAFKTVDEVNNVLVEVTLANGIVGYGAANPSQYVTGESFASCAAALEEAHLAAMVGRNICEYQQMIAQWRASHPKNPAAVAAVDIALHDAFAKYLGVPLVKYLGQHHDAMPTSVTIGIKNVNDTLREAEEFALQGFTILKVKLGKDLEEDIERVTKLRERYGRDMVLRVDANQGYTLSQTQTFYNKTLALELELIEQPLPAADVAGLRQLPEAVRNKIAADESLLNATDALALLTPKACGIFNIKLMKCGGIAEAITMAKMAERGGVDLFWGCNDESIISIAAALHAAFASRATRYIDLDGSLDLAQDVVRGGFEIKNGIMRIVNKPGLGVEPVS